MEFFGCTFLAFGPAFAMFILTIAKDPVRIILLIASAFFWLLSLLLSSLLWYAVVPLRKHLVFGLVFSVIFQECFRFFYYKILRNAESGLKKVTEAEAQLANNRTVLAYVSGLGFGLMSGAFSLVNVLADSIGPGTVGLRGDSNHFFITSALTTLAFILLHIFWGVTFFQALDQKCYWKIAVIVCSHMGVSLLTLLNPQQQYVETILPIYIVMVVTGVWAYTAAGGTIMSLQYCLSCRPSTLMVAD